MSPLVPKLEQDRVQRQGSGAVSETELAAARAALRAAEHDKAALGAALRASEARERALAHELQHRVRNILALIRSIYRRTRENGASQEEFAEHFQGRLDTIARYQGELLEHRSGGIDLEEMVRDELLQVRVCDGPRLTITGGPISLRHKPLELLGLAIHELTTNAIKFGALYHQGSLRISWSVSGPPDARVLHFCWRETAVPLIAAAPRPRGFGRQLIEEAMPYELGATTSFAFRPGGIECSIHFPLPASAFLEVPAEESAAPVAHASTAEQNQF